VRITDRILLSCKPLGQERFEVINEDFQSGIPPYNQEGLADIQMYIGAQTALNRLQQRDKDLADFLKHLDTKMNALLRKLRDEKTLFDELEPKRANLSGSGLAFSSAEPFTPEEKVELHIVLLPCYIYIYSIGKIVSSEADENDQEGKSYKVAVEFILLMENDREKLIQHNFKKQSLALRNRRLEP
jgi:hypothetical protein